MTPSLRRFAHRVSVTLGAFCLRGHGIREVGSNGDAYSITVLLKPAGRMMRTMGRK